MMKFIIGDDLPAVYFKLYDRYTGNPADLSASTTLISAKFRALGDETTIFEQDCDKVVANIGICKMEWPTDSLDSDSVEEGPHEIEISVSWNGSIETGLDKAIVYIGEEFAEA